MELNIRRATTADSAACGIIYYEGFKTSDERHGFQPVFSSAAAATERVQRMIEHKGMFGIVAEENGSIVGFNFLSEHDPVRGGGPIVIDPAVQGQGIGRRLMAAVLERARNAYSIRLVQEAYNVQSLCLYSTLGFDVKEPLVVMVGLPRSQPVADYQVRRMSEADLPQCEALHIRVHGFTRTNELRDRLAVGLPIVALRDNHVRAYLAVPTVWLPSHGVADNEHDMQALLLGAAQIEKKPLSFLLPVRNAHFFRWCIAEGLRATRPMRLMSIGKYDNPQGSYFPSVLY